MGRARPSPWRWSRRGGVPCCVDDPLLRRARRPDATGGGMRRARPSPWRWSRQGGMPCCVDDPLLRRARRPVATGGAVRGLQGVHCGVPSTARPAARTTEHPEVARRAASAAVIGSKALSAAGRRLLRRPGEIGNFAGQPAFAYQQSLEVLALRKGEGDRMIGARAEAADDRQRRRRRRAPPRRRSCGTARRRCRPSTRTSPAGRPGRSSFSASRLMSL